eukprot:g4546.t1
MYSLAFVTIALAVLIFEARGENLLLPLRNEEGALLFSVSADGSVSSEGNGHFQGTLSASEGIRTKDVLADGIQSGGIQCNSLHVNEGSIGNIAEYLSSLRTNMGESLKSKIEDASVSLQGEITAVQESLVDSKRQSRESIDGVRAEILERLIRDNEQRLEAQQARVAAEAEAKEARMAADAEKARELDDNLAAIRNSVAEVARSFDEKLSIAQAEIHSKIDAQQEILNTIVRIVTKLDFAEDVQKLASAVVVSD